MKTYVYYAPVKDIIYPWLTTAKTKAQLAKDADVKSNLIHELSDMGTIENLLYILDKSFLPNDIDVLYRDDNMVVFTTNNYKVTYFQDGTYKTIAMHQ